LIFENYPNNHGEEPYPLYPRLGRASRHDAVSLIVSLREFDHYYPDWQMKQLLLDAAHDAMLIS
jgi:hypothetical protein